MYEYNASPIRIIDGDTIVMDVDLGFHVHVEHAVRLLDVSAPELGTPQGIEHTQRVTDWFVKNPGPYTLRTRKGREFEKYGRLLGTLTSETSKRSLNDDLKTRQEAEND